MSEERQRRIAVKHAGLFFAWLKNDGLPVAHADCLDSEEDRCELSAMAEEAIMDALRESAKALKVSR